MSYSILRPTVSSVDTDNPWINPDNALAIDGVYTSYPRSPGTGLKKVSVWKGSEFTGEVPSYADIQGIELYIKAEYVSSLDTYHVSDYSKFIIQKVAYESWLKFPDSRFSLVTYGKGAGSDPDFKLVQAYDSDILGFTASLELAETYPASGTIMTGGIDFAMDYAEANSQNQVAVIFISDGTWTDSDPTSTVQTRLESNPTWNFYVFDMKATDDGFDTFHAMMQNLGENVGSGYFPIMQPEDFDTGVSIISDITGIKDFVFILDLSGTSGDLMDHADSDPLSKRLDVGLILGDGFEFYNNHFESIDLTTTATVIKVGGPTDKWGKSSWSVNEVNNLVQVAFRRCTMPVENTATERLVDACWMFVYWNDSGGLFEVAERESVKQKILLARESVHGTAEPCTTRVMGFNYKPSPKGDFKEWRSQGNKNPTQQLLIREWSEGAISGHPFYTELGIPLQSNIAIPQSSGGTPNTRNVHVFTLDDRYEQDVASYTIEYGQPDIVGDAMERMVNGVFDQFGIDFSRTDASLSGQLMARALEVNIDDPSAGTSEIQTVTPSGTITGGTFKLAYKGLPTAPITWSGTGATLATSMGTALNAIQTIIDDGGVTVVFDTDHFNVTFGDGKFHPLFTLFLNSLTGTNPAYDFGRSTAGGFVEMDLVPILPGHVNVYLSESYATLSSNKLTRARMAKWSLTGRSNQYWTMDRAINGYLRTTEGDIKSKFDLQLQANSNGMDIINTARAAGGFFIRLEAVGPNIGATGFPHKFVLDSFVRVSAFGSMEDQDNVYQVNYEFTSSENKDWGNVLVATLENGIVSYG